MEKRTFLAARDLKSVCWAWGDCTSPVRVPVDATRPAAPFTAHLNLAVNYST